MILLPPTPNFIIFKIFTSQNKLKTVLLPISLDDNTNKYGANRPESGTLTDSCILGLLTRALSEVYGGL